MENKSYKAFKPVGNPPLCARIKNKLEAWNKRWEKAKTEKGEYSEKELLELVEIFGLLNEALWKGLPDELYDYFCKTMDYISAWRTSFLANARTFQIGRASGYWETEREFAEGVAEIIEKFIKEYPWYWIIGPRRDIKKALDAPSLVKETAKLQSLFYKRMRTLRELREKPARKYLSGEEIMSLLNKTHNLPMICQASPAKEHESHEPSSQPVQKASEQPSTQSDV